MNLRLHLALLVLPATACLSEPSDEIAPISSLTVAGHTVEWIEPAPGLVAFGDTGPAGETPLLRAIPELASLSPTEQWARLAATPAPGELVELEQRMKLEARAPVS